MSQYLDAGSVLRMGHRDENDPWYYFCLGSAQRPWILETNEETDSIPPPIPESHRKYYPDPDLIKRSDAAAARIRRYHQKRTEDET